MFSLYPLPDASDASVQVYTGTDLNCLGQPVSRVRSNNGPGVVAGSRTMQISNNYTLINLKNKVKLL